MFACGHLVGRDDEQTLLGIEGGLDVLATGRYLAEAHLIALDARHLQTTYLLTRLLATDAAEDIDGKRRPSRASLMAVSELLYHDQPVRFTSNI